MIALKSIVFLAAGVAFATVQPAGRHFAISVVDEATGRGVPLVELTTVNHVRCVTDSQGLVAFDEPGLMGQTVFFHARSHGYEFPADGFGFRGASLRVTEGGSATLKIRRLNLAERLYRVTGAGNYRDSVLLGRRTPLKEPVLDAQVLGSDSVQNAVYQGKLFWFWGDTNRASYPLGNFNVPGAVSRLPADGGLDPSVGVDLDYFRDERGFAKETARMPGPGPTWIDGLVALRDPSGRERLFAAYVKIRNQLEVYERGLAEWDPAAARFEKVVTFPLDAPCRPGGHAFDRREGDTSYVYFATPYPLTRVLADPAALRDPARYECFTCLPAGTRVGAGEVERDADGQLRYAWKRDTPPVGPREQQRLAGAGKIRDGEGLLQLRDVETGRPVTAHSGSVSWNAFRKRWVMIAVQSGGTSFLGEVWYAEADTPVGPWVYTRKVVTHDRYSFYNPAQHPEFDQDGGRRIYFEGTYAATFSGSDDPTPRYDYNQIMYRLDLADPRLALPVPVYGAGQPPGRFSSFPAPAAGLPAGGIACFGLDRPGPGAVPVFALPSGALQVGSPPAGREPVFYALPADLPNPPATTVPLYEYVPVVGGAPVYACEPEGAPAGYERQAAPVCRVWRKPPGLPVAPFAR